MESLIGTLKTESVTETFGMRAESRLVIFEYIEVWYNRRRIEYPMKSTILVELFINFPSLTLPIRGLGIGGNHILLPHALPIDKVDPQSQLAVDGSFHSQVPIEYRLFPLLC